MSKYRSDYRHLYTGRNLEYEQGLVDVGFRSCLLNNNSEIQNSPNAVVTVETEPKYVTSMRGVPKLDNGELDHKNAFIYLTDSHKSANGRVVNKMFEFCDFYQPLYKDRSVSLAFHTLTTANDVLQIKGMTMPKMMDVVKYRYKTIDRPLRGYIWVSELSEDMHWHYHLLTAFDRLNIRGKSIPEALKLNDVWGANTQVEFVKRSVKAYLSKYMAKCHYRVLDQRRYSSSQQFK